MFPTTRLSAEQLARLHDNARRQAQQLRRAAIADFWRGVHQLAASALHARRGVNTAATRNTVTTISRNPTGV